MLDDLLTNTLSDAFWSLFARTTTDTTETSASELAAVASGALTDEETEELKVMLGIYTCGTAFFHILNKRIEEGNLNRFASLLKRLPEDHDILNTYACVSDSEEAFGTFDILFESSDIEILCDHMNQKPELREDVDFIVKLMIKPEGFQQIMDAAIDKKRTVPTIDVEKISSVISIHIKETNGLQLGWFSQF